ncbi:hypothetical protein K503DRAFT_773019 [Rhizopogon vinicolor AM-OR11-026]|uniref:Wax synthase domain-containing protein n=1 Tax=Rhizopogon vinicolor AM-OR11-026 TaxID=1314800 RepID=A0A1B7MTG6_9AGAM|nr:hypothetical protein K503DRAFT_773019 [Rhizopogon vinicolor AM-OR11-026]
MRPLLHVQLPYLTLQILLCLNPSPPWDLFSALALSLVCYLIISLSVFKLDTGVGYVNYMLGSTTMACALDGFYLLLLGKPLMKFKYVGNGNGTVHKIWWKRFFDVICVPHSPRAIGWSHQVKNIPPAPRQSRRSFVLRSTLRTAWYVVLFETGRLYVWYRPAFSSATIGGQGYVMHCIDAVVFIGLTYWPSNAIYFALAAGSVATGLYEPRMWPDLFGAWADAYTIRRFWGRTWHQMLRRFVGPLGQATSSALGFKHGTLGSSYTQLYIAFFLSGLMHTGGDIVLFSQTSAASWSFFSMPIFISQAFAITLEDMFIGIAGRLNVKGNLWTRALGYVWVAAWFGWCVPKFVENVVRAGGEIMKPGDGNAMDSNLVQAMLGLLGFNIGEFVKPWFRA